MKSLAALGCGAFFTRLIAYGAAAEPSLAQHRLRLPRLTFFKQQLA